MAKVTFLANGQTKIVEAESGKTILQIALDNSVPMEHACGGNGFCNTCLCKVTAGAEHLSPVNDQEKAMGIENTDRLGCQAVVNGDATVEIL